MYSHFFVDFLHVHTHRHHVIFLYRLSLCEKALAEYLDTKRLAFPRFYFISSADLLDILSNGTNPHQVGALLIGPQIVEVSIMVFTEFAEKNYAYCGFT